MKSIRDKFVKHLSGKVKISKGYAQIRNEVDFNEIIAKNGTKTFNNNYVLKKAHYLILTVSLLVIALIWILIPQGGTMYIVEPDLVYNPGNVNEVVAYFDYIFVARVDSYISTQQYDGIGTDIPYTFYNIDDIDYLQGNGSEIGKIAFYGGVNKNNRLELFMGSEELPSVDTYYLFIVQKSTSSNGRIEEGTFIVSNGRYQMLSLENFDISLTLDSQNEDIINLILPYKEMIYFYDMINQLSTYEEPVDLISDLQLIARETILSNYSFVDFTSLIYVDTIVVLEKQFVLFQYGTVTNNNFSLFILELEFNDNLWSVFKTNKDRPLFPQIAEFTSIDYNNNSEFSFDNAEISISINDSSYSLGFSVLKLTSDSIVLYNGQNSEKTEVSFNYESVSFRFYLCYAVSIQFSDRVFELIDNNLQ